MTKKIILSGIVQGVGMRFFVRGIARRTGVRGFVRNMPKGTVYVMCQGEPKMIAQFINLIRSSSPGQLDNIETFDVDTDIHYKHFSVKF